jgi:hypothetical protein
MTKLVLRPSGVDMFALTSPIDTPGDELSLQRPHERCKLLHEREGLALESMFAAQLARHRNRPLKAALSSAAL